MAESRNVPTDRPAGHSTQRPLRVVIADDRRPARQALEALLTLCDDVEVAGVAVDGQSAVSIAAACQPDVVVMDARMPGMSGMEAASVIKSSCPGVRVVITSMYPTSRSDPFSEVADAFLLKGFQAAELRDALLGAGRQPASTATSRGRDRSH